MTETKEMGCQMSVEHKTIECQTKKSAIVDMKYPWKPCPRPLREEHEEDLDFHAYWTWTVFLVVTVACIMHDVEKIMAQTEEDNEDLVTVAPKMTFLFTTSFCLLVELSLWIWGWFAVTAACVIYIWESIECQNLLGNFILYYFIVIYYILYIAAAPFYLFYVMVSNLLGKLVKKLKASKSVILKRRELTKLLFKNAETGDSQDVLHRKPSSSPISRRRKITFSKS